MSKINHLLRQNPVAIVGMASVFADAENLEQYWENIVEGVDCIKEIPATRWNIEDYYDPDPRSPDKTYCKVGGFLPDLNFNPLEFGLPPNILEVTDASQLLGLAVARDALIDAGYAPGSERLTAEVRERTGVILGVGGGQKLIIPLTARLQYPVWTKALRSMGMPEAQIDEVVEKIKAAYIPWTENSFPGLLGNVIAGRIANRFDLGGVNSVVDAACAASLSATKMALAELIEGRCDMMITGGVDTDNSIFMYMSFSKTPAFSQQGSIRPFDHESDGMLIGEGVGMVVCKRLEDALRDGDRIYATIRGIGGSSDGRYKSVYAPRPQGQALAMQRAYDEAGFDASTVGLIEAHGTGTGAGDPSEGESMKMVFGKNDPALNHIALGSVKSQIGHTKAAAGVAGLIKAALALHHKILPGTINVTQPNPKLNIATSPLYVNAATRPWFRKQRDLPRRAGVSAFGFGGVNIHLALEEHEADHQGPYRRNAPHKILLWNGARETALEQQLREARTQLEGAEAGKVFRALAQRSVEDVIPAAHARLGMVAASVEEARQKLTLALQLLDKNRGQAKWEHPLKGIWYRQRAKASLEKTVALFSGQGAQYPNMGDALAANFPTVRAAFERANQLFEAEEQAPLTATVYPIPVFNDTDRRAQQQRLTLTQFAQPAIGALSAGMYQLLRDVGFEADLFAGHSYGELTALWAAGVLDDAAFYELSKARGQAMAAIPGQDAGTMLAVKTDQSTIAEKIRSWQGVKIANVNSPSQIILGGPTETLQELKTQLKAEGYLCSLLPVSAAFHTPFVGHAQAPFAEAIAAQTFRAPQRPVYSNTTGQAHTSDPATIKTKLANHLLQPVLFRDEIENLYAAGGRIFIEFGPKSILTNLAKETLHGRDCTFIALNPQASKNSDRQFREGVVQLAVLGIPVQRFDRFQAPAAAEVPVGKLNVRISGYNHVSERTQKNYRELLQTTKHPLAAAPVPTPASPVKDQPMTPEERAILTRIQSDMAQLAAQQNRIEALLTARQAENKSRPNTTNGQHTVANGTSTIPLRTPSTNGNGHHSAPAAPQPVAEVLEQAPVLAAPVAASGPSLDAIQTTLLTVIAEKTGYPAEMLELGMDMEADLGIDSIKRVEIFGAMTGANPDIQGVNPQELAELRTLQQIVDYIANKAGTTTTPVPVAPAAPAATAATPATPATPVVESPASPSPAAPASTSTGLSTAAIQDTLLAVIAEKTGYPAEMLELGMDMEADLGIDSIKRVEIFGAMTSANPDIQGVNPQELAELRTLQQIVDYIASKAGATTAAAPTAPAAMVATPVVESPVSPSPAAPASTNTGLSTTAIQETLLAVIAEKTGYPAEMLELGMDMEADLGIDSIKRVEIFGAMTSANPDIQGVNPQELAELRTLQQIVDYIASKAGATTAPATPAAPAATVATPVVESPAPASPVAPASTNTGLSTAAIQDTLLAVIAEKTGYPAEMLELGMDMEADLGIDSIKRVEIFGAMTSANPDIQGVNPQELAELRTLQQIVDYIASKAGATTATVATPVVESPASPSPTAPATTNTGLSTAAIQETLLAVIAEKTGYPAEMLELGMDMEADLGIDSIKRVEIFGAMTSANPDIQGVNPQELAELRTLQQIVDYIAGKAGAVEGVVKKKSDALGETLGKPSATHFQHRAYPNVPRVEAFLQYLPQPDQLDWPRAADDTALVVSDGTHWTPTLIQSLAATGYRVICLQLPVTLVPQREASFPAGTQLIQLADTEESTLQRCLAELAGEVRHVFHLHPHLRFPLGKLGLQFDREKAIIKAIFLLAKLLKPTLNKNASQGRCSFCCITRMDGAMGRQNPGTVAIGGGAFFGLTKSLNLEWPKVFCRSIDLAPQLDTSVGAEAVLAEWRDADRRLTEIAYAADGKRYTLATRPSADLGATPLNAPITTESVFLVTGGAKGITADCVRAMAETFRCKFILVGRSALGTEPSWAQDQEAGTVLKRSAMRALQAAGEKPLPRTVQRMVNAVQSQREIRQTLSDVQAMGAEVHYLSADVTDALALRTALEPLVSQTGPITGILHGAGRLADKLIENKTAADFDAVYDVKIQGLLAVTQAIDIERIQQVVLFSSVAGFYGNVGQTDYAIANEILNRAAFLFQQNHPDTQVVSINWGAWDAGMVSPALKKVFEAHGVSLVPSEEGPWALVDQLSEQLAGQTQVILGGTLPLARAATDDPLQKHTMHRELRELANPFLRHHVIQDNAVLPIIHASNWMAQAAVDFYPGFHLSRVAEAKLFKGIVFDGRQAERYQLELVEQEKSEERIVVGVKISSRGSARLPINHYGALVTLQKEAPTAPVLPLPTSNGQAPFLDDASAVYTNGTLFHGSDFRGVQQILRLDRKGLLLRCEHPGVERERQGQFPVKSVNPYLTDIMYQSLLIWVREFHHCASLPLRTEWVEVFAALPFGRPFYVALEVVEANDFGMEADITAYDAQSGRVYLKSHRAGVTISKELQW